MKETESDFSIRNKFNIVLHKNYYFFYLLFMHCRFNVKNGRFGQLSTSKILVFVAAVSSRAANVLQLVCCLLLLPLWMIV